jgi:hypothetical protein
LLLYIVYSIVISWKLSRHRESDSWSLPAFHAYMHLIQNLRRRSLVGISSL